MQKDPFWSAKGVLLESKTSPFEGQKESFWNAEYSALDIKTVMFWNPELYQHDKTAITYQWLTMQTIGGYGVPAVACAAYRHILSIRNMERFDSSGYGEDAITSYD